MIQLQTRPSDIRYIAIEGVIGAGKTTLAKMITERLQAKLVLEKFEECLVNKYKMIYFSLFIQKSKFFSKD